MSDVSSFNPFGPSGDSGNPPGSPYGPPTGGPPPPGHPTGPGPLGPPPSSTPGQSFTVVGPPSGLLFTAGALALVGLAVAVVGAVGASWVSLVGWAIAGPVAIVVLGLYLAADTKRQTAPVYTRPGWVRVVYGLVAAVIVVAIVVGSVGIALWIGHL